MDYLKAEVKVFDPDIIGITESWTDDKVSDAEIQIEGCEMFRRDRLIGKSGGVLLYIRDSLVASAIKLDNVFPEQVWCKLSVTIAGVMRCGRCVRPSVGRVRWASVTWPRVCLPKGLPT